jgi:hypothetical protein
VKKRFDIFWFEENGPTWIEAPETLQTASDEIEKLPQHDSGSYASVDHRTATVFRLPPNFVRELGQVKSAFLTARTRMTQVLNT